MKIPVDVRATGESEREGEREKKVVGGSQVDASLERVGRRNVYGGHWSRPQQQLKGGAGRRHTEYSIAQM